MGKMVRGFKEHKNAKAAMLFAIAALIECIYALEKNGDVTIQVSKLLNFTTRARRISMSTRLYR
jgi:hypothetical protein